MLANPKAPHRPCVLSTHRYSPGGGLLLPVMDDDERAVAGGLVVEPERFALLARTTNRADDFQNESARMVYICMLADGVKFTEPLHYRAALLTAYRREFHEPLENAASWLADLENWGDYAACHGVFEWHSKNLAARGAVRRVREEIGRWYVKLTDAKRSGEVTPREFKDAAQARSLLASLLRDLRKGMRSAPEMPTRLKPVLRRPGKLGGIPL